MFWLFWKMTGGNLVVQLIVFGVVFSVFGYGCVIGDPDKSELARLCTVSMPSWAWKAAERAVGRKQAERAAALVDRALQMVYLVVVLGSWSIMFAYGYPFIERSQHVGSWHQYSGYLVFLACMGSWQQACRAGPGNITARSMPLYDHYEYDDLLYCERICPTLKIRKLARSKFDRFSRRHVPRFDHFCGWLHQAVGERNYRWFLLFLLVHVAMCAYGSAVVACLLQGEVTDKNLLHATFFNTLTGAEVKADWLVVAHYIFLTHFELCAVFLLMSVMALVLGAFLAFHLFITARNMTTNEFFKWRSVRAWHAIETKKYQQALKNGTLPHSPPANPAGPPLMSDSDVTCTGPLSDPPANSSHAAPANSEGPIVASGPIAASGPIHNDDIIDPGPMPENIYNKGIIANFYEVIFPLSFREEAIQRYRVALTETNKQPILANDANPIVEERKHKPKVT